MPEEQLTTEQQQKVLKETYGEQMLQARLQESAVAEALTLVYGERAKDYGNRTDCFHRAARIMNAIKDLTDVNHYTGKQVALMMIAMKQARRQYKYKRDNNVDIAGYTDLLETLETEGHGAGLQTSAIDHTMNMNMTKGDGKETVMIRMPTTLLDMIQNSGTTPEEILNKGIKALEGKTMRMRIAKRKPAAKKK